VKKGLTSPYRMCQRELCCFANKQNFSEKSII
jgi:hypothetical protein